MEEKETESWKSSEAVSLVCHYICKWIIVGKAAVSSPTELRKWVLYRDSKSLQSLTLLLEDTVNLLTHTLLTNGC